MKSIIFPVCCLLIAQFSIAQSADALYKKGDSLYKVKEFEKSAIAYTSAIKKQGKEAEVDKYWTAAKSWSMANVLDTAFNLLSIISNSERTSESDTKVIENDKDFTVLRTDKRWNPLMDKMKARALSNYSFEELIYGRKDGVALTMLHLKPKSKSNGKAIIRVVAGSWFSSYQQAERSIRPSSMYIERGYTIFLVVVASQPRYAIPDEIEDVKRAVRYIRYNANKLKVDPDHIGIEGSSAGGHLSLAVATADEKIDTASQDPVNHVSSRVQAVTVLFPPTDFLNWGINDASFVNLKDLQLINAVYGAFDFRTWNNITRTYDHVSDTSARNKIAKEMSPINYISSDDPPVFIIHGDADRTVPIQQSETFISRLKQAGVNNKFIIKKGGVHNPNDMMPELKQFVDWFDKYLK
ncbi:MAG: alpha/beta hydrolase [Chitinophagaceae bacterium]